MKLLERIGNIYILSYIINFFYKKIRMNKIEKIAELLGITLSSSENEIKLSEANLADGSVIYTDAETFDVGSMVTQPDADNVMQPVASGEYTLTDGTIIVCDEAGVIVEVKAADVPADGPAEEPQDMSDEGKTFNLSEEAYNGLVERIAKLEEVLLGAVEALNSTNKNLTDKVEKLSAQPGAEPLKPKYNVPVQEDNALSRYKKK